MPRFDGQTVRLGEQEYVVPPLSLGQIRRLQPTLDHLGKLDQTSPVDAMQMDMMLDVMHAALSRNYPELSKDMLVELLDLGNIPVIMQAVMGVSGLKKAIGA